MYLALVGDKKGIQPQKLSPHGIYFPSSLLTSLLSLLLSEKNMVVWY